jgi:hypothetical protein
MSEATCQREACSCCGAVDWTSAHFAAGVLVCATCCAEIRRAQEASKPKPAAAPPKQTTLAEWLAPQSRRAP